MHKYYLKIIHCIVLAFQNNLDIYFSFVKTGLRFCFIELEIISNKNILYIKI